MSKQQDLTQSEYLDRTEQLERERDARNLGATNVADPEALTGLAQKAFVETLGDPDIVDPNDPNDDLAGAVAPETSKWNFLGNYDEQEYFARNILGQTHAQRIKLEYPAMSGPSSKCVGDYRAILLNDRSEADRERLTPGLSRRIDRTVGEFGVSASMTSLGKDGKGWKGITVIQSVVSTLTGGGGGSGSSSSSGGLAGRAKGLLFRSD